MATIKQIQFKRTTKAGVKPTAAQLTEGELAINLTDRTLFTKDHTGLIIDLGFAKGGTVTGDINQTGNFNLSGDMSATGQVKPSNYSNFDSRYPNLLQLGANVNLNTLDSINHNGEYAQHANVNTSLELNYPEAQAGHLTITSGAGVQQTYRVYNSSRVYLRSKYSASAWTPWDRVVTDGYLASGVAGSIVSTAVDGFRVAYGKHGFFIRNEGNNTYFLLTNSGDSMGGYNNLRPLTISNSTGQVSIGTPLVVTHASGINVTSTAGNAISWGNAGACVANDGNIYGTRWANNGNTADYLAEYLRKKFDEIQLLAYPVGAPIPWPSVTVPNGYVAMEGQTIAETYTELRRLYGTNLPDMRGQTIKGLPASGRNILSREGNQNKAHNHTGTVAAHNHGTIGTTSFDYGTKTTSSFDYGTKTSNTTGNHTHGYKQPRPNPSPTIYLQTTGFNSGESGFTTDAAGNHAHTTWIGAHTHTVGIGAHSHTVAIGSHAHGLTINNEGGGEVTVNNIAFKYIVKLA